MARTWLRTRYTNYVRSGTQTPHANGDVRGIIEAYLDGQDFANNTSKINLVHKVQYVKGTSTVVNFWSSGNSSSYRAKQGAYGGTFSGFNFINESMDTSSTKTLGTKTFIVNHNENGEGVLWVDGSFNFNGRFVYAGPPYDFTVTRSSSFNDQKLPTIPRGTTITSFNTFDLTITSVSFVVMTSNPVDWIQHSLNGSAWVDSGTQIITDLSPNTQYNLKVRVRRTDNQVWTESNLIYFTTLDIARFTSVGDNINVESSPTITINRNNATTVEIGIFDGETAVYPYSEFIDTEKELTLTASNFYNRMPLTSKIFQLRLKTNDTYIATADRTFIITNANPIFNNFTYRDTNATTVALTGNNQSIIKDYSYPQLLVLEADKAIANKGATILSYQFVIGSSQQTVPYQASGDIGVTFTTAETNVALVYAIDSRNLSTVVQKSPTNYFNYFKPVIAIYNVARENYIGEKTILSVSGTYFNANFGAITNEVNLEIYYRVVGDDTWILSDSIASNRLTYDNTNWEIETEIAGDLEALGFSADKSFQIKIVANDKLDSVEVVYTLAQGTPNLSIHKDGVAINALYDEVLGGDLQIAGKRLLDILYPVGTIYETTSSDLNTSAKMDAHFGGTWEEYGSGMVAVAIDDTQTEFNTIGKTGGSKYLQEHTHKQSLSTGGDRVSVSTYQYVFSSTGRWYEGSDLAGEVANAITTGDSGNIQPYIVIYRYRRIL